MIRAARAEDAAAIAALLNHWIATPAITFTRSPKTAEDIADQIAAKAAAGHGFFVAEDGALLGQASYGQFRAGAGYATCMEHSISLAPGARGQGLGRALLHRGRGPRPHGRRASDDRRRLGRKPRRPGLSRPHGLCRLVATVPQAGFKFGRFMDLWLMQKFL
jgi:L-amino acid N-acyltransferase YncA